MLKTKLDSYKRKEIAKILGITTRTLNNWEKDINTENYIKYIKLLYLLGIEPIDKLNEYEEKKKNTKNST